MSWNLLNLVTAFPFFSLTLKFGIKKIQSLFQDGFQKGEENPNKNYDYFLPIQLFIKI